MLDVALPHADMAVWAPGIVLLGLLIGTLSGLFGVGGGFLLTPALRIFFGLPWPIAVGSGLLLFFITSAMSAFKHWRRGNVDPVLGTVVALGALGGTRIGTGALDWLDTGETVLLNGKSFETLDLVMSGLFVVLLAGVAISIYRETSGKSEHEEAQGRIPDMLGKIRIPPRLAFRRSGIEGLSLWAPVGFAFCVGILTGLLGVGGGFINFPLLVYIIGVPTHMAVGTSAFQILFASGFGAYLHYGAGNVELILVALLFGGAVVGVQIGVALATRLGGKKLRRYFAGVVGLGVLLIVGDFLLRFFGAIG